MAINDRLNEIENILDELKKRKQKKFRIPFKARISKKRMREGYITIAIIRDNKNIDFVKEPIVDGTYKLNDTIHAVDEKDIFFHKGKPFVFQPKRTINPYNPLAEEHQTYGQKYIMSRMESDKLTLKKQIGWGMSIGVLLIVGVIVYSLFTGG